MATRTAIDQALVDITALDDGVRDELGRFTSGDTDLDDFVRSDAGDLQRNNVVRTYLARYRGAVEGYVSLLTDAVVLETSARSSRSSRVPTPSFQP